MAVVSMAAVLTGDIVESTKLSGRARALLPDAIHDVAARVVHSFPAYVPYALDFFRGDSWQWLVIPPGKSLRMAVFMRSLLLNAVQDEALDTRIAIGIGKVQTIPENDLARADGEAFRISGELLESFDRNDRLRVALKWDSQSHIAQGLDMVARLLDLQAIQWTRKQAHAVAGAILGYTQQETARHWFQPAISQQAVAQHLDRAGWLTIKAALGYFEEVLEEGS